MKVNWFVSSIFLAIIGGMITYLLVESWKFSLFSGTIVFIILVVNNPIRRYMKAFYVTILPLLSNFFLESGIKMITWILTPG
jgi:hypothetical protein